MKCTPLLVLVVVGLVSGDGAWEPNEDYTYRLNARTFTMSPESKKWSGSMYRMLITIRPQSKDVLVGQFSHFGYAAVNDREENEIMDLDVIEKDLVFDEMPVMNSPFEMHLENGNIRKVLLDHSLTNYETDELKTVLSQFQVNTNAENMIEDEANRPPTEKDNNAMYKVMESSAGGNCETVYECKDKGKSVEITKTRNNSNCDKNKKYQPAATDMEEEISHVILSGSLKSYTIVSSVTSQTISVNGMKSYYRNMNVTLESFGSLVDAGSLALSDSPSDMVPSGAAMSDAAMSDISLTELQADKGVEYKWSNCWGAATGGIGACKKDLGPEFEYDQGRYKTCVAFFTWAYVCKKTYPGCVASDCFSQFAYPPSTFCEKQFGKNSVTRGACIFDDGCFPGFDRNRCCPRK